MINRLKKLGWTPEMLSDLDKLYEYPGFEDQNMIFEFIQNNDTKTIIKALNSVNDIFVFVYKTKRKFCFV